MLEMMSESHGNILGFKAGGNVTLQDVRQSMAPQLETVIIEHSRVRVLLYLQDDFEGFDLKAITGDAFGHRHKDDIEKIAVAGGPWWFRLEVRLAAGFLPGEVKTFSALEFAEAWEWVRT